MEIFFGLHKNRIFCGYTKLEKALPEMKNAGVSPALFMFFIK
jgi:hypothetical protein